MEVPPKDILLTNDGDLLCQWLCTFFLEVRKSDGSEYCPRSLQSILSGLHRYIESNSPHGLKIQSTEGTFAKLHTVLENLFKRLHQEGIGAEKRQATVISSSEEQQLWASGVFSTSNPQSLLNAIFFYNGMNFVLRGGEEHRSLTISQLQFGAEKKREYVIYTEFGSKNRPGGKKQLNLDNKSVRQYAQPDLGEQCHVHLLKLYLSLIPTDDPDIGKKAFYYKPLSKFIPKSKPWYSSVPIGHNTLDAMLKNIFMKAGMDVDKISNHSLRATSITRMYNASLPEKLIMERSGHLSKEGLRTYEHTSETQHMSVCQVLSSSIRVNQSQPNVTTAEEDSMQCELYDKENSIQVDGKPPKASVHEPSSIDALKPLNFQTVTGCTINISFNMNK